MDPSGPFDGGLSGYIFTLFNKDTKDSESDKGSFLHVRVTQDVTISLCRGRIFSLEHGEKGWVFFKYERLPNLCYWCGCLNYVDRDCDKLLESEGMLVKENQEYRAWIHDLPFTKS